MENTTVIKTKKRRYSKIIVLDNCNYLRNLKVLMPEELMSLGWIIKDEFFKLEQFYKRFFSIPDFTKDLTVKFHLKARLTKSADFDRSDCRKGLPLINVYAIQDNILPEDFGSILAHEFAHFIDWKLRKNEQGYCYGSGNTDLKDSEETQLAQKYKSLQEVAPSGAPFGGCSAADMNSNCELYARYCEQFYKYTFYNENFDKAYDLKKNCHNVKAKDFKSALIEPINNYLNNDIDITPKNYVCIDGNLYSNDRKVLIKYESKTGENSFTVPDGVEIIRKQAFSHCENLIEIHISDDVKIIGNMAFAGCENLKKINGGKNVLLISDYAFSFCDKLEEISGLNSVEYICDFGFGKCKELKTFELPESLKIIETRAFYKSSFENMKGIEHLMFSHW